MNFWDKIFGKKAGEIVANVGVALDDLFTSKEEKEKALLAVQQEVNRHMEELARMTSGMYELEISDRERASRMQVEALHQDDKFSKRFIYYLAGFTIFITACFGLLLCFFTVPEENRRVVEMFADFFFISSTATVFNFFYGSSKTSHDKKLVEDKK